LPLAGRLVSAAVALIVAVTAADVPGVLQECDAMAAKKKKRSKTSVTQQIAGIATMGMPAPVQKVASSRWGSKFLLIAVPILIASGIISISFTGGFPTVNVNRERAAAVGRDLTTEAYKAAERVRDYGESGYR
jgi:hypothetical protein